MTAMRFDNQYGRAATRVSSADGQELRGLRRRVEERVCRGPIILLWITVN